MTVTNVCLFPHRVAAIVVPAKTHRVDDFRNRNGWKMLSSLWCCRRGYFAFRFVSVNLHGCAFRLRNGKIVIDFVIVIYRSSGIFVGVCVSVSVCVLWCRITYSTPPTYDQHQLRMHLYQRTSWQMRQTKANIKKHIICSATSCKFFCVKLNVRRHRRHHHHAHHSKHTMLHWIIQTLMDLALLSSSSSSFFCGFWFCLSKALRDKQLLSAVLYCSRIAHWHMRRFSCLLFLASTDSIKANATIDSVHIVYFRYCRNTSWIDLPSRSISFANEW